jgi:hypothetical protein
VQNGHVLNAKGEKEWRDRDDEGSPNAHSAPPSAQRLDEQKHHHGPVIRWERFLPVKTLRVLLVENDDCTRHIVGALLRKCGYEGMYALQLQPHIELSSFTFQILYLAV